MKNLVLHFHALFLEIYLSNINLNKTTVIQKLHMSYPKLVKIF